MKYIKKIVLENFQSHKHTEIELNKKLNIIVGQSDSGKTAILRAIKWALYNEPSGDFFIREGENEVTVSLVFSDNTKLTRYRSRSKNVYELEYNNGKELRLEGFGLGVPEEVKEAIGIYKINLDGNESNSVSLAEQLEGPFLLSEKTSTRAAAIGQLVGVDVIDQALREVLRDSKGHNNTKKNLEIEIDKLSKEIKTYDYLDDLREKIGKLSTIREKIASSTVIVDKFKSHNSNLANLYKEIEKLKIIKNNLLRIEEIDKIITSLESLSIKYWQLNNYNRKLKKLNESIRENQITLDKLLDLDLVTKAEKRLVSLNKKYTRLVDANLKYRKEKKEANDLNEGLVTISKYLKEEEKIKKMEKINNRVEHLNILNDKFKKVKYSINMGKNYIKQFEYIDESIETSIKLQEKIELLQKLKKECEEILINRKNIQTEEDALYKLKSDIKQFLRRYKLILNKIEKCPLCLSEISNNSIEHIMDHFIGG